MFLRTQKELAALDINRKLTVLAKELRVNSTPAEIKLWAYLRGKRFHGLKFRRQHPFFTFIVDFYCHELKLIIELDGQIHEQTTTRDRFRDKLLKDHGYTTIRFRNEEIINNIELVLDTLSKQIPLLKKERETRTQ